MENQHRQIAELLFPHIKKTADFYETMYPDRKLAEGALVTRLAPSPTGYIHLGNLYAAFANERLAHQSGGIFYLRIEDTDSKREVEGAAEALIHSLGGFDLRFDEGVTADGETGDYGPYYQSKRAEIYQCYVKKLVSEGKAYPCFLTEEEIAGIREKQEASRLTPGIYGEWAVHRFLSLGEIKERVLNGKSFVLRFRAEMTDKQPISDIEIKDGVRGRISMPANTLDVVILKTNGLPTYHFAHVVDDHLMRTTHVIRGEEWLSSLPIHIALFKALGWAPPAYCHTTVLMKAEGGTKRKLSKRKDPELSLGYYRKEGYHPDAIKEYLMTILNSNYEEWRAEQPYAPMAEFIFTIEKMSNSGILFDIDKLRDVSKDCLLRIPAEDLADFLIKWAAEVKPEAGAIIGQDRQYLKRILDIGRSADKPRKDLEYAGQILMFISYFYDEWFRIQDEWPENIPVDDVRVLLKGYLETYDHSDTQPVWFDKIRKLSVKQGYAAKPKDYKTSPRLYKGHVGDVSTVIRIAITGRRSSPDLWEIQQILGADRVISRIVSI